MSPAVDGYHLRGPHGVGVRTETLENARRNGARFTVELWYPSDESHAEDRFEVATFGEAIQPAARDAPAAEGRFPLVLWSHGYGGHRRQLAYLACHLASHGYVVACADHEHLTLHDVQLLALSAMLRGERPGVESSLRRVIWQHPSELWAIAESLRDDRIAGLAGRVDDEQLAVGGLCLGSFVAMKAMRLFPAARALVLLAPIGGNAAGLASDLIDEPFEPWNGADALVVGAEHDCVVTLDDVARLFARLPAPKRLARLRGAEHLQLSHLGDTAQEWLVRHEAARGLIVTQSNPSPLAALAPTDRVHDAVRALVLLHLETTLRAQPPVGDAVERPGFSLNERIP